jgi:hypothetical protein
MISVLTPDVSEGATAVTLCTSDVVREVKELSGMLVVKLGVAGAAEVEGDSVGDPGVTKRWWSMCLMSPMSTVVVEAYKCNSL